MKKQILFQLDMCWQLYNYHMETLTDEEALWVFDADGLQVREKSSTWKADWPHTEAYEIGPASIAWILWHIIYWWSTALNYNFGDGSLTKDDVIWPGSVCMAKAKIQELYTEWKAKLDAVSEDDLEKHEHAKWPFENENFATIALWLNAELMKNAAEIGYGRFLYCAVNKK